VILNQVASEKHRRMASAGMPVPVLGAIPRDAGLSLPERHLGLVQASEHAGLAAQLDRLADMAERYVDLDAVLGVAQPSPRPSPRGRGRSEDEPSPSGRGLGEGSAHIPPPGQRIALAQDAAFSFIYPHLLAAWRLAGAEILPFSPLADEPPADGADCCWLPGGYPELHGATLAAASRFQTGLRRFAASKPVHGECGGYMVLGTALTAADGTAYPMAGLLGHATSFARRSLHLGYRRAVLPGGAAIRGHEFHYATVIDPGTDTPYAAMQDAAGTSLGPAGGRRGHVTGSFFHAIATEVP
jgi:cobyrinic acid a,c-diamide synthase